MALDLKNVLETELADKADEDYQQVRADLEEQSVLGTKTQSFFESALVFLTILAFIVFSFVVVYHSKIKVILASQAVDRFSEVNYMLYGLVPLAICIWLIIRFIIRRKKMLLTLTPTGFFSTASALEIPWSAVNDYDVTTNSINDFEVSTIILIDLAREYTPPEFQGDSRIKYNKNTHKISVSLMNFQRPFNPDKFSKAFHEHLIGASAREELLKMNSNKEV